ncbi:hypothetical protein BDN67DRAFT_705101 [Paxillus ammoniavirescens]|nr:hypothetical protein BDN67DRAFT_705101 [Paxillus ammoniavirescens]
MCCPGENTRKYTTSRTVRISELFEYSQWKSNNFRVPILWIDRRQSLLTIEMTVYTCEVSHMMYNSMGYHSSLRLLSATRIVYRDLVVSRSHGIPSTWRGYTQPSVYQCPCPGCLDARLLMMYIRLVHTRICSLR